MAIFEGNNPLIVYDFRKGSPDDPYPHRVEGHQVVNGRVKLPEIPVWEKRVDIKDKDGNQLKEIQTGNPETNEFRVDYNLGIVFLNSARNDEQVTIDFYGKGVMYLNTSLLWTQLDIENKTVIETLEDIISNGRAGIEALKEIDEFEYIGEYVDTVTYKKYNTVFHNQKTYLATEDIDVGESPEESSKWKLVSSGYSWRDTYSDVTTYRIGDMVSDIDKNNIYVSVADNNTSPLTDTTKWNKVFESNETQREQNESTRVDNESTRVNNEKTRQQQHETRMQEVDNAINTTLLNYLEPVSTFSDISTTYPSPTIGDVVELTDPTVLGQQYRWDGTEWKYIAKRDVSRLSNEIGDLSELDTTEKSNLVNAVNETVSELAQKANLEDVQRELSFKRDKSTKLELEDMSETVITAIQGGEGTSFNLLSIPQDGSVTARKTENAIIDTLRPPNVTAPFSYFEGTKDLNIDIYIRFVLGSYGSHIVGDSIVTDSSSGYTKFSFMYRITDEMRKWGKISFGVNIDVVEGNPTYAVDFFDENGDSIIKVYADLIGNRFIKEGVEIPPNAVTFGIYAQGNNVAATYTKPILTYGDKLGYYNLDYFNKVFEDKIYTPINLLSTDPTKWQQGSQSGAVGKKYDEFYYPISSRIILRKENMIHVDAKSYDKLYYHVPENMNLSVIQCDENGIGLIDSGWIAGSGELSLRSNAEWVVVIIRYVSDEPITPEDIESCDIYLGYYKTRESILSDHDIKYRTKKTLNSIDTINNRISIIEENVGIRTIPCPLKQPYNLYKYIGHSGMTAYAPENTLEAYRLSKILGMWGAEADLHMTADNEIVLMHDATVDRTTDGTGAVADMTLAQIKELNIKQTKYDYDVKVPSLDEFILLCKNLKLAPVLEIKTSEPNTDGLINRMLQILESYDMIDQTIVISFSKNILEAVRSKHPQMWIGHITGNEVTQDTIAYAKNIGNFVLFNYTNMVLTKESAELCRTNGIPIIHGTANTQERINYALNLGVDAIVTDKFYDLNKPGVKYTVEVRTTDGGNSWEVVGSINNMLNVTFDTSFGDKLGIKIGEIPSNWLFRLYPSIEVNGLTNEQNMLINSYYDSNSEQIIITFFYNNNKVSLGDLPYTRFKLNINF